MRTTDTHPGSLLEKPKTSAALRKRMSLFTRVGTRLFGNQRSWQTNFALSSMALPGVILLLVFAYLPMIGLVIAFKDYRFADGILGSDWVGLANFRFLFGTDTAWRITRNTLAMNSLFILVNTVVSLGIAMLLNEVFTSRLTKFYQTLLFFPYFISWVIASYFVYALLDTRGGLVNQWLLNLQASTPSPGIVRPATGPLFLCWRTCGTASALAALST